jgi:hypothetical protein
VIYGKWGNYMEATLRLKVENLDIDYDREKRNRPRFLTKD